MSVSFAVCETTQEGTSPYSRLIECLLINVKPGFNLTIFYLKRSTISLLTIRLKYFAIKSELSLLIAFQK